MKDKFEPKKIMEVIIYAVGYYFVASFMFTIVFSLVGKIPMVKEYNQKKDKEISERYIQEEKLYKKKIIGKYAVQPNFDKYDGLFRAYSRIQWPSAGTSFTNDFTLSSMLLYENLNHCELFLKALGDKDASCKKILPQ